MNNYADVLSEEFLLELYSSVFTNDEMANIVANHMDESYLPDRVFTQLQRSIKTYVRTNKSAPTFGTQRQHFADKPNVLDLLSDIEETSYKGTNDALVYAFEQYIKGVRLQQALTKSTQLYTQGDPKKAGEEIQAYANWANTFSLFESGFVDIIGTFRERYEENKRINQLKADQKIKSVNRFFIDDLDVVNDGKDLRTQHTCLLAPSGVGKSTAAIYIGSQCAIVGGLNVLHFSLEMSKNEVEGAYSGASIGKGGWLYRSGRISESEMQAYEDRLKQCAGRVYVKSWSRFGSRVSTMDIKNAIHDFRKATGENPDVVIVDSMDLLSGASKRRYDGDSLRHERVEVANDLKDIAGEENVWMLSTYQSTIEDRKLLNDENFVLSEYNLSESKGIIRPLTHLITLNQTFNESQMGALRLHVAKSRFFKKGGTFRIITDYDNGLFYNRIKTLNQVR